MLGGPEWSLKFGGKFADKDWTPNSPCRHCVSVADGPVLFGRARRSWVCPRTVRCCIDDGITEVCLDCILEAAAGLSGNQKEG